MKFLRNLKTALRWYSGIVLSILFLTGMLMMFETSSECTVTTAWDSIALVITLFPILWYVAWEIVENSRGYRKKSEK